MRNLFLAIVGFIIVVVGVAFITQQTGGKASPDKTGVPRPTSTATSPGTPVGAGRAVAVTRVVDGDTLIVGTRSIRLLGIDTPERGECGYATAKRHLADLVMGKPVHLTFIRGNSTDKYKRLLRFVDVGDAPPYLDAGRQQIADGYANARYDDRDGYKAHPRETRYHQVSEATRHQCPDLDSDGPQ